MGRFQGKEDEKRNLLEYRKRARSTCTNVYPGCSSYVDSGLGVLEANQDLSTREGCQPDRQYLCAYRNSVQECLSGANVCFIATPWKEFQSLSKQDFLNIMSKNPTILDGWNLYSFEIEIDINYIQIGKAG